MIKPPGEEYPESVATRDKVAQDSFWHPNEKNFRSVWKAEKKALWQNLELGLRSRNFHWKIANSTSCLSRFLDLEILGTLISNMPFLGLAGFINWSCWYLKLIFSFYKGSRKEIFRKRWFLFSLTEMNTSMECKPSKEWLELQLSGHNNFHLQQNWSLD